MLLSLQMRRRSSRNREDGYVLLALLLVIALMAIFAATLVTSIKFEIKRDREEEMVHRGVQYTRAIRAYYRKFNRFPAKIEDLENTNQLRFLRKRYKDPLTGKDFKLVHFGEVKLSGSMGIGGGTIPGANTIGANGTLTNANGLNQTTSFGNSAFGASSNSGFGQSANSGFGQNSNAAAGQNQDAANGQNANGDTTQAGSDASPQGGATGTATNSTGAFGSNSGTDKLATTQFGGAPIVGVASTSKDKTIREFDKKKKYNEWMFVYDPMLDRGGLIKTPYQPQLMMQMMGQGMQNNLNGQNPGQNGASGFGNNNNSFGNSSGFGNSPGGMQNSPTSPGSYGNPQPNPPPPQQQ
jgi:type II secretory pathway pseudopilin PulG